jgi:hypothetical protein
MAHARQSAQPSPPEALRGPVLRRIDPRAWALTLTAVVVVLGVLFSQFMIEFLANAH